MVVGIALARTYAVVNLYELDDPEVLLDEAEAIIARAARSAPDNYEMLKARALLLRAQGRFREPIIAIAAIIARSPAEPIAYKEIGLNNLFPGHAREAIEWFHRADLIAPRDPERWTWLQGLGRVQMHIGGDAAAVASLSTALERNPGHVRGKAMLAAANALRAISRPRSRDCGNIAPWNVR
jgi:tetratricopeptide (TPR) repeat protein